MMTQIKTYTELIKLETFEQRFEYLKLNGLVGDLTFNGKRPLNQILYHSPEWRSFRRDIILRDNGCDLAHPDHKILGNTRLIIHHLNPITPNDIVNRSKSIFDPENVILTTHMTHEALHYGSAELLPTSPIERKPGDTNLW